jgi:RNA polymerase sigma-70 factor (ECF subfamily)
LAGDVVQDAALRALRHIATYSGGDGRAWFLRIVRNVAYDALAARKQSGEHLSGDDGFDGVADIAAGPEEILSRSQDQAVLARALAALPLELRECLVLRELEGFSYKDIAVMAGIPTGTVMSRLWRARQTLMENAAKGMVQ